MAPVANRRTIVATGSTSSIGIDWHWSRRNWKRPRKVFSRSFCWSTMLEYFLKIS